MLAKIYALQSSLGISDGQILLMARQASGDAELQSLHELLDVDAFELQRDLERVQELELV